MNFRYLSAYAIRGISQKPNEPDVQLVERPDINLRATLTGDVDAHCYPLDRRVALAEMTLSGKLNAPDFDAVLGSHVAEIRDRRRQKLSSGGVLIVEGWGDVEARVEEPKKDFGEFLVCWDAFDKNAVQDKFRHVVTAIVTSLCIASPEGYTTEKLAEGTYLIDEGGKVVHSFSVRMGGATVYVSRPVEPQIVESTRNYSGVLAGERGLERVSSLFVQSLNLEHDDFRRFLFGWTALEILVAKVFSHYEQVFVDELISGATVHGTSRYFERIKEVMRDKYRLVDKFSVVATVLVGESSDADVQEFKRIKGVRDKLLHGQDVPEALLPNVELQALLSKYFGSHLERVRGS